jgi:hypothetical protein
MSDEEEVKAISSDGESVGVSHMAVETITYSRTADAGVNGGISLGTTLYSGDEGEDHIFIADMQHEKRVP